MKKWYRGNEPIAARMNELLERLYEEFGWTTKIMAALSGRYIFYLMRKEERSLARGWTYEPASFYEKNASALALEHPQVDHSKAQVPGVQWVSGELSPLPGR